MHGLNGALKWWIDILPCLWADEQLTVVARLFRFNTPPIPKAPLYCLSVHSMFDSHRLKPKEISWWRICLVTESQYICCLQRTKCADGFDEIRGDYRLLGLQSNSRHYGLGFAVTNWLAKNIIRFWSVSNRVAVIQFRLSGKSIMTVINAYGPTRKTLTKTRCGHYGYVDNKLMKQCTSDCTMLLLYLSSLKTWVLGL